VGCESEIMESVKFQVLTAVGTKMTAFWGIAPCSLVEVEVRTYIAMMMEAVCTSETSVYFNITTRRYIQEGCQLQSYGKMEKLLASRS
jgi:hypothetical protein